jgi:hypothetical protein
LVDARKLPTSGKFHLSFAFRAWEARATA